MSVIAEHRLRRLIRQQGDAAETATRRATVARKHCESGGFNPAEDATVLRLRGKSAEHRALASELESVAALLWPRRGPVTV
jgi:hypothetical protein